MPWRSYSTAVRVLGQTTTKSWPACSRPRVTPIAVSQRDGRLSRTIVNRWRVGPQDLFRARGDGLVLSRSSAGYIVQHLRDPAMTPKRIAAAHHVSL